MSDEQKLVLLATGGTGGHVTPAQALSRDLLSRGYQVAVVMDYRGMKYAEMFEGVDIHTIPSGTLKPGIIGKIKGVLALGYGVFQGWRLVKKLKPAVVVGFGGYPCFPSMFAAQKMKIPTIIHEQNAKIGKANAMLAPGADRIALSLPLMGGLDDEDQVRAVVTGNPVRAEIAALYNEPYPSLKEDGPLRIFVMGGSLGARVFSKVLPRAFAKLDRAQRKRLHVVQQCREEDLKSVRDLYEENQIEADLKVFFDDVADQLKKAHLVIGRSGASSVAEVTTAGRPAIFVPYPHHKDQQQKMNAEALADNGGAWIITEAGFTEDAIFAKIESFLQNPETLFRTAERARAFGRPDSARKLGNLVTAVMSGWN